MQYRTLYPEGNFYSGNLHTHSNLSDGANSPEEVAAYYRDVMKLDFLAITDHNYFKAHPELSSDGFLMIPGLELNTVPTETDRADHHVVGIYVEGESDLEDGTRYPAEFNRAATCQSLIDELNGHRMLTIFAHPFWSRTSLEEGATLKNVTGMEILNFSCAHRCGDGYADPYYDAALLAGNAMWCFATDDAHNLTPHDCGGHITVRCDSLTNADVCKAIRDGSFYASEGPEVYDFFVEDGTAHISCSPVQEIQWIGWRTLDVHHGAEDEPLNGADFDLPPFEGWRVWKDTPGPFVRAVLVDEKGRRAWTQPIFYK